MNYTEIRNQIQTGDLIAVRKAKTLFNRMTQFFTRGPYTHTGVAIWIGARLFMAEINDGRNHLVPISQLDQFDVYKAPAGLTNIDEAIFYWLARPIDYGYLALGVIGLIEWLRLKVFVHWRRILVCSGFCVAIYETAGWPAHSRMVSPNELASELELRFAVG